MLLAFVVPAVASERMVNVYLFAELIAFSKFLESSLLRRRALLRKPTLVFIK